MHLLNLIWQKFYSSVPVRDPTEYEVNHVCRYHSRKLPAPPRTIYAKNVRNKPFNIIIGVDAVVTRAPTLDHMILFSRSKRAHQRIFTF